MEDAKSSDIVYSTIHSAKGLEFTNVCLSYNNEKKSSKSQESLRLYFVGLSRAMKSELIINAQLNRGYRVHSYNVNNASKSAMFIDPINVAHRRCINNIQNAGLQPAEAEE